MLYLKQFVFVILVINLMIKYFLINCFVYDIVLGNVEDILKKKKRDLVVDFKEFFIQQSKLNIYVIQQMINIKWKVNICI